MAAAVPVPLTEDSLCWVSPEDFDRVSRYSWSLWSGYPHNSVIGLLHSFIIGPRPVELPASWTVVDHIDRSKLNADGKNLRWVSQSFNIWNQDKRLAATSKYKGVCYNKPSKTWRASIASTYIGSFASERQAGLAVAKKAMQIYPDWAATSDLLLINFSAVELQVLRE